MAFFFPTAMADAFLRALAVVLFVFTTWLFGAVARRLSAPALVGEVVAGMVLGPKGLDAVPHDEAFALIGAVGLALLVEPLDEAPIFGCSGLY